jgi:hypothetical protein
MRKICKREDIEKEITNDDIIYSYYCEEFGIGKSNLNKTDDDFYINF